MKTLDLDTTRTVKTIARAVLAGPAWRRARRLDRSGCIVLVYHRIGRPSDPFPHLDVASFEGQMKWLRSNCDVIDATELRARAAAGGRRDRPAILVTFDDGYLDYFENAYPVLKALRIRALNFLSTAFVDDPTLVSWWDLLHTAIASTNRKDASLPWAPSRNIPLNRSGKKELLGACKAYIKGRPEAEKLELTRAITDALGVETSGGLTCRRQIMNWDEVRAAADWTSYGGHTHNHVIVSRLDTGALELEIATCRDRIASETGSAPRYFAFPNGRAEDFDERAKAVVRQLGFEAAFSSIEGVTTAATDWFEIRRLSGPASVSDLAWQLSRVWSRAANHDTSEGVPRP